MSTIRSYGIVNTYALHIYDNLSIDWYVEMEQILEIHWVLVSNTRFRHRESSTMNVLVLHRDDIMTYNTFEIAIRLMIVMPLAAPRCYMISRQLWWIIRSRTINNWEKSLHKFTWFGRIAYVHRKKSDCVLYYNQIRVTSYALTD